MNRNISFIGLALIISSCSTVGTVPPDRASQRVLQSKAASSSRMQDGLALRAGVVLASPDAANALNAEQYALASAPAGEAVNWQGRYAHGTVVAASPYQVGDQNCRQYTQRIFVGSTEHVGRGAACREANEAWILLN